MTTEVGIVGKIEMNEKGMGVCLDFLRILEQNCRSARSSWRTLDSKP
ncbi:hypothetical protein ACFVS2_32725 [Brevibacillus sp. NPDC058079]